MLNLVAEKRIAVIQLDDSSDEEVTFISPATENVKAVNTRFAVIKEEKLEADVSQNCSGNQSLKSHFIYSSQMKVLIVSFNLMATR